MVLIMRNGKTVELVGPSSGIDASRILSADVKRITWENRFSPAGGAAASLRIPAVVMRALGCPDPFLTYLYFDAEVDVEARTITFRAKDRP